MQPMAPTVNIDGVKKLISNLERRVKFQEQRLDAMKKMAQEADAQHETFSGLLTPTFVVAFVTYLESTIEFEVITLEEFRMNLAMHQELLRQATSPIAIPTLRRH